MSFGDIVPTSVSKGQMEADNPNLSYLSPVLSIIVIFEILLGAEGEPSWQAMEVFSSRTESHVTEITSS